MLVVISKKRVSYLDVSINVMKKGQYLRGKK